MKVAILGTGGHARELLELVRSQRAAHAPCGFVDEDQSRWGTKVAELPVLGGFDWLATQSPERLQLVCGVGRPASRKRLTRKAKALGFHFISLVHPSVIRGRRVELGEGTVLTAGCVLTEDITLGDHVHLNLQTTISHDGALENYAICAPGVHLAGNVTVGEGAEIGIGAVAIQGLTIGAWSVVGAGAVMIGDVPPNSTVVGVPARVVSERPPNWQE